MKVHSHEDRKYTWVLVVLCHNEGSGSPYNLHCHMYHCGLGLAFLCVLVAREEHKKETTRILTPRTK